MAVTLPEVEAAYTEINNARREGREPDLSQFSEEVQEAIEQDPVARPTFWGQELQVEPIPSKEE